MNKPIDQAMSRFKLTDQERVDLAIVRLRQNPHYWMALSLGGAFVTAMILYFFLWLWVRFG